ncbi:MAG: stage II sporulation protein M [Robiginitomaculum sp.]
MAKLQLKSHKFRSEREADWKSLEGLLGRIEKGSLQSLSDGELIALPALYRSALSSLSVARATSLDQGVIAYLESLSARAYFMLYGTRTSLSERLGQFFARDWPVAVRSMWKETAASFAISLLAGLVAYLLVINNMDWYYNFMPDSMAGGRSPAADTEYLRDVIYGDHDAEGLSSFATMLFSHNSRVAIFAFALGFVFCIPTALLMAYNGAILGAFYALHVDRGLGFELTGWLMIHGTTELFAIILAGAAGFKIGLAVAFPKEKSRLDAASIAGKSAATVLAGVVVMLFIAGLIEGFLRQLITSDFARYAIAISMLAMWLFYFYGPRSFDDESSDTPNAMRGNP